MKGLAVPILRRLGFRTSLTVIGVLAACSYAVCGLFRPGWPFPLIFAVLVVSGFLMSFQFTAYNTIAFDEIVPERMSGANAFYSTFQQLTLSLGHLHRGGRAARLHGVDRPFRARLRGFLGGILGRHRHLTVLDLRQQSASIRSAGRQMSGAG